MNFTQQDMHHYEKLCILMLSEPSLALKKCSGVTTVFDTHLFLEVIKLNALGRLDNVLISTHMIYFQKLISLL